MAVPLLAVLVRSLLVTGAARGGGATFPVSPGDFVALFGDPRFRDGVENSLIAGAATTVLTLVLGFTLAFLVARTDMIGRRWLGRANMLPLFLSPYAGAVAWTFLLATHDGLLPTYAREVHHIALPWLEIYSVSGVIFILTLFHTPIVYLILVPPLRDHDAAFEETARVHGATFWSTLRHITLPMTRPALSTAAAIVFLTSAGLFDVPAVLGASRGIRFIPTEIFAIARTAPGTAAAFAVVVVVAVSALMPWLRRFVSAAALTASPGGAFPGGAFQGTAFSGGAFPGGASPRKDQRPRLTRLRWPVHVAALTLEAAYLSASVLLPLFALLLVATSRHWTGRLEWRTATTMHFERMLAPGEMGRVAIGNSLILAVLGATIGVVLAVPRGWSLTRGAARGRGWTERLLAAAYGMPGMVIGLGFLLVVAGTPLRGTLAIVLIACVARCLPIASRLVAARSREIDPYWEQVARASGATARQTARYIVAPLLRRTLLASWLLLFVFFIRELGTPILLYSHGNETMSVAMTVLIDRDPEAVAVLALLQMAILVLGFIGFTLARAPLISSARHERVGMRRVGMSGSA